ncbi:hypothetical protein [Clostridiisalibacter paucivorans]|uniref:hypothetical protein n=1 Tax=Clostridiisalibacter paucivorans TaxID=408753 RepID=UPI00047B504B|nr:hypothetical protein [Clostridiisalibacter paucivorans]
MKKQLNRVLLGNIGKLFAIYYSNFLNEPIDTKEKEEAWSKLVRLLDSLEEMYYTEEVREIINKRYSKLDIRKSKEKDKILQQFMLKNFTPIFQDIEKHLCILSSRFKKFDAILNSEGDIDK